MWIVSCSQFGRRSNNLASVNTGSHGNLLIYAEIKSTKYWMTHNVLWEAEDLRSYSLVSKDDKMDKSDH